MTIACAIEMVGDLSRRNTPALLVAEEVEKAVFELRKLDVPSAERRRHPRGIDRQLSGDDERGRMSRGTADERARARDQFADRERLGHIVLGAGVDPLDLFGPVAARRQDKYWPSPPAPPRVLPATDTLRARQGAG